MVCVYKVCGYIFDLKAFSRFWFHYVVLHIFLMFWCIRRAYLIFMKKYMYADTSPYKYVLYEYTLLEDPDQWVRYKWRICKQQIRGITDMYLPNGNLIKSVG